MSETDQDQLGQLRQATAAVRARIGGAQSGTATTETDEEPSPKSGDDSLNQLRAATASVLARGSTPSGGTAGGAPAPAPRVINLDLDRAPSVKPTALLNAPQFQPPTASEMLGAAIPEAAVPALAAGEKYLVQPFETLAGAGAEAGGQIARLPLEVAAQKRMAQRGDLAGKPFEPVSIGPGTDQGLAAKEFPKAAGAATAIGETVGGMAADPRMWALSLGSVGSAAVQKLMSAGFSLQSLYGAAKNVPEIQDALKRGDTFNATRLIASTGIQAGIVALAGAHALSETPTVGAGENLHPEKPETLQGQVDHLKNGTLGAVYIPKGQAEADIPTPPDNANVTVVNGNKPGAGTWYHSDEISPEQIRAAVRDGTYHELLGITQSKEQATANGQPATIVARDEKGTELKAALADGTDPNAIAAQAAVLARQFPDAKIGTETPEQVIASRQAPTTEEKTSTPETGLSAQTQGVERRSPTSPGVPPNGMAERRTVAQGLAPVDETIRLRAYYDSIINDPRSTPEDIAKAERAKAETEPSMIGGGGEEAGQQIREARAKESGQPMSIEAALANEAKRKAGNQPLTQTESLNIKNDKILAAMDTQDLSQRVADIEARQNRGEQIPLGEIDNLHSLMDKIEANHEPVRESTANQPSTSKGERVAPEAGPVIAQPERTENAVNAQAENSKSSALSETSQNTEAVMKPAVGDRVQVAAGPLKGRTLEVTKAGESGVYGRIGEGPIKFIKNGDFESRPSLSGATAHSNPLFDPEVWKSTLGYLKPAEAAGQENLRARTGELARKQAVLQEKMKGEHARWRGRSDADMLAFADMVENGETDRQARGVTLSQKTQALLDKGKKSLTTQDKNLAATLRTLLDQGRASVQKLGTGKLDNFIENYFPHVWEQKGKVGEAIGRILGKRPLEGPNSFLKQRTIPTTAEGFDAGLKPVTTNPVDLALLKMHEMNRYVMAHRLLGDLKNAGTAEFVPFGQRAPEGWAPLDDKVFQVLQYSEADKGMILRGRYYAPAEVAQPINRYVASGLKGIPVYDMVRGFGNSLNQLQLGLSGFHLGTTSLNSVISQFALGAKQAARGEFLKGTKNILTAPAAPIRNLIQGGRVAADYLRPDQAKEYATTAKAVETAGGRVGVGEEYIDNRIERMLESFANRKYFKGALQAIPAAIEAQAIPVLKWTVPRMKLGAFHDLASDIFDRAQKNNWPQERVRSELQKSWDSIDNRFGQVVYDNLNWNKMAKDLAFIGVRSVGWNYGTWRELGGGVKDLATQVGQALNKKGFDVTDRMAYTFALPVTIATLGGLYMYAHTGKWPQTAKDYFYPKNGKVEADGTEARASLPSYMKDVFAISQHPVDTALHKVNPAISLITEMLENKDYYGNEIRNTDDPAMAQLWQAVGHVGKSFLPFTLRNAQKRAQIGQKGVESQTENFLGITPAPRSVEQTDAEALAHEMIQRRAPAGAHTTAEQKRQQRIFDLENQVRSGTLTRDVLKQKLDTGEATEQDAITAIKRARTPGLIRAFKQLSIPEAMKVWDVASDKERNQLRPWLETKVENSFPKMTREDQDLYRPLLRRALGAVSPSQPSVIPFTPPTRTAAIPFRPPAAAAAQR